MLHQDDSYFVGSCTEIAPSEPGFLEVSQRGHVQIEFSESDYDHRRN